MIKTHSKSSTVTADNRRTEGSINIKQTDKQHTISISNNDTEQKIIKQYYACLQEQLKQK